MTDPHTLPPLSFAPLEGITGWIFRQVHHAMFPGLSRYYTPFFAPTADSPLTGRGLRDMHPDHNRGVPVVPQLLTNRAEDFIASARLLQDLGYKEVNLNLGCPSGTVVAKKKGAGFLSQPQALARFLDQIFQTLDVNISIKTRIGVENLEEWPPLLDLFQRYPICELIIHPRLRRGTQPPAVVLQRGPVLSPGLLGPGPPVPNGWTSHGRPRSGLQPRSGSPAAGRAAPHQGRAAGVP